MASVLLLSEQELLNGEPVGSLGHAGQPVQVEAALERSAGSNRAPVENGDRRLKLTNVLHWQGGGGRLINDVHHDVQRNESRRQGLLTAGRAVADKGGPESPAGALRECPAREGGSAKLGQKALDFARP